MKENARNVVLALGCTLVLKGFELKKSKTNTYTKLTMDLVLDPKIRDWVLIPIVVVMFIIAILRHNITKLLMRTDKKSDLKAIKEA